MWPELDLLEERVWRRPAAVAFSISGPLKKKYTDKPDDYWTQFKGVHLMSFEHFCGSQFDSSHGGLKANFP